MESMSRAEPKHMCSWWWASHISPKNSKWLQENLADMDSKVKLMIKLIEVDEDSFARRAEMYYKKRPELMKLVEELYRAYRALAERYDHATGVIRHAHKTMAEAFPNQVPILESVDGLSASSNNDSDPYSPEMSALVQAFWNPGELDTDEEGVHTQEDEKMYLEKAQSLSECDRLERSETDIKALKEALSKLEAEKEVGLAQYQQSAQRLCSLESEVLRVQEDSRGFHERASKAEAEVWSLKEFLFKLEGEREDSLSQYQQCLDRISGLESYVSRAQEVAEKRGCEAEKEAKVLKEELAQLKNEKEAGLGKYMEALENIAEQENKLLLAEDKASLASERADHAEKEVVILKEALARITEEKEAAAFQYHQCLEKIASLENEIDEGTTKLKSAEEQCLLMERSNKSAKTELESALFKMRFQSEELSEKQKEVGRLWTCVQEERVRVVEAETTYRTLQGLHCLAQEELRSVAAELQKRVQLLKDMEVHNQKLQGEVQKFEDENKSLNQLSKSSSVSIKNMHDEILSLKEGLNDLHEENSKLKENCQSSEAEISVLLEKLDLRETNCSLLKKCEKLLETSTLSEKLISELEDDNTEQKEEVSFLSDQITRLRSGMFQLLKVLEVDVGHVSEDNLDGDQMVLRRILVKLDDTSRSLFSASDDNQKLVIENSVLVTLLGQLKQEVADLKTFIDSLMQEFSKRKDQLSSLQGSMLKLLQSNEKLLLRVGEGKYKEEFLASEVESLREKLREMQGVCDNLEKENFRILEENRSLSKVVVDLDEEKLKIELENSCLVVEAVTLDTLSFVFKNSMLERSEVVHQLFGDNRVLEDKVRFMDGTLGEYRTENMSLRASLETYDDELKEVKTAHGQLECEIANAKDKQGKEIHDLSERYNQQLKEAECLRGTMQNLEAEICRMNEEHKETNKMAELWEAVADTTFVELQTSSVCEALYREKFLELTKEYQYLVDKNYSDVLEVVQLKERVGSLEGENSKIKAQWAGYVPAMATLRDTIASLERHVLHSDVDNGDDKDSSSSYRLCNGEVVTAVTSDGSSRHFPSEAMEEQPVDERHHSATKQPNQTTDPQEVKCELAMKDIMFDQASEASPRRNNRNIWYNNAESDDQIVELWETNEKAGSIRNEHEIQSSEIAVEKELRVDSLELSKRYTELDEAESNNKVLERLSSDTQKLTNLQITVHDLKQKVVMITESLNPTKGTDAEYSCVTEQLEEAEGAIVKLQDVNVKLVKHVEDCSIGSPLWPTSSPITDPSEIEESERMRRKVSEQARRCSEKIGRLQVEVQKIQFLLLKLDSGNTIGRSSGIRILERERKVPLRDYLYGRETHMPRRRRKASFCACVQPLTSGD